MSAEFREKLKSLHFQTSGVRERKKVTVDRHDEVTVTVTEHYSDRVDVNVAPKPVTVTREELGG